MFGTEMTQLTDQIDKADSIARGVVGWVGEVSVTSRADYQRARLRLGILGVGVGVLMSAGVMVLTLGGIVTKLGGGMLAAVIGAGCLGGLMVVWQGILDAAGRRLDAAHRLHTGSASVPSRAIAFRGILESVRWLVCFVATAGVASWIVGMLPTAWPIVLMVLTGLGVLIRCVVPERPAGSVVPHGDDWERDVGSRLAEVGLPVPRLVVIDTGETTLAGGWMGRGRVWVSRAVSEASALQAATLVARELVHQSKLHRLQSAGISFVSLCVGIGLTFLIVRLMGDSIASHVPSVVLTLIATMTLLSFASLFVFPAIGRRQVLAVDRMIADRFGRVSAGEMLDALAGANLPDESLSGGKAYVFHPIPTMSRRRQAIERRGGK